MGYPVAELQARMSSQEFTEWCAYSRIEPFGFEMDNWRAAMIAAEIVNAIHRTIPMAKGAKRPKPLAPSDFYPVVRTSATEPQLSPSQAEYLRRKRERRNHNR